MKKKLYVSPLVRVLSCLDMESQILGGSIVKFRMTVDPLTETYYEVDDAGNETNADYLIKF